jgi:hypothetical protein
MTCVILQDASESDVNQPRATEHPSWSVRTSLDVRQSPMILRCHEDGGLGIATTLLLIRSPQIQSNDY